MTRASRAPAPRAPRGPCPSSGSAARRTPASNSQRGRARRGDARAASKGQRGRRRRESQRGRGAGEAEEARACVHDRRECDLVAAPRRSLRVGRLDDGRPVRLHQVHGRRDGGGRGDDGALPAELPEYDGPVTGRKRTIMLFRSTASLSAASLPESERELAERSAYTPWHPRHPTYGFTIPPPSARERRPLVDERGTACAWGAAMGLGDTAASEPRTPRRRAVSFRHEAKRYKSPPRHTSRGQSPVRGRTHDVLEREAAAEEEHVERMRGHAKVAAKPRRTRATGTSRSSFGATR